MFENIVDQSGIKLIELDLKNNNLPSSIMFSGDVNSGKLTAALELARVLSCTGKIKGIWSCDCPSCLHHKALTCSNMMLLGPRDCSLEISAAKDTFVKAYRDNTQYLTAARYFFIRSIRKLTLRFNGLLLEGDKNISNIAKVIQEINDLLEEIDFPRHLIPFDDAVKLTEELEKKAMQLESSYLYDSIPVNQIRNMEDWAHIKSDDGKKTIIIENADRMMNSVRNALLKILEEPPADCQFILLTSNKNAVIPTILSRLRNYTFNSRSVEQQNNVIKKIFRNEYFNGSINEYLESYLPVPSVKIKEQAKLFYTGIVKGSLPDVSKICKDCGNFEPRNELKIFLNHISELQRPLLKTQNGCEAVSKTIQVLRETWENVTLYNQSVIPSLEILVRDISKINVTYGRILCVDM